MTEFIHLSLKTTLHIDWDEPLSSFLTNTFGRSFAEELKPAIVEFNKSRIDIENSKITDMLMLSKYLKYYYNIQSLDMRIPLRDVVALSKQKEDSLGLQFTWTDVFDSENEKTSHSVAFEKASILFNVAALHSYNGAKFATELNWKASIDHFAKSAGILDFIATKFHNAPTDDLKVDIVKGLSKLMISQALEGFLWNYLQSQSNIKHSLVARLAEGTSINLRQCDDLLSASGSKSLNFKNDVAVKADYLHAFALVHNADSYYELDQVGNALASLKMANEVITASKRQMLTRKVSDAILSELVNELKEEIKQKEITWEKDNDLIYHQKVPANTGIPLIKPMEGVKIISLETQLQKLELDDLFEKIVPMEAHEGLSIYSEKQADILRRWTEKVEFANEQIISTFEFLNLPTSVREVQALIKPIDEEEREQEDDYPRVLAMAHDMESSAQDGIDFKLELQKISSTKSAILAQLDKARTLFERDQQLANRGLLPAPEIQRLQEEVHKIQNILTEAGASDDKLKLMWDGYERDISILKGGTDSVQKWLNQTEEVSQITQQVNLLDLDMQNEDDEVEKAQKLIDSVWEYKRLLDNLIRERNSTLDDVKFKMHSEDISMLLIQNKGASQKELDCLFDKELNKYETYTTRISNLIDAQEEFILELKAHLGQLLGLSLIDKKVEERKREKGTVKAKIASLTRAYDTWNVCRKGVKEAGSFYNSFGGKVSGLVFRLETLVNERERLSTEKSAPFSTPSVYNPSIYSQLSKDQNL